LPRSSTSIGAPAPRIACVSQTIVSSCSSSVARYALSMMFSAFTASSTSVAGRDDQRVDRVLGLLPEVARRAAAHAGHALAGAAFVDAQAAVDPIDAAAVALCLVDQRADHVLGQEMVLLFGGAAVHGVGVRLLARERLHHGALVSEHLDVAAALRG